MLDFNSLANFALNAFFSLIIRKVSSCGAIWRGGNESIFLLKIRNPAIAVDKLRFFLDSVMEIYILIALLSRQRESDVDKSQWDIKVNANNKIHINK